MDILQLERELHATSPVPQMSDADTLLAVDVLLTAANAKADSGVYLLRQREREWLRQYAKKVGVTKTYG